MDLKSLEAEVGFRLLPRLSRAAQSSLCGSPVGCALMPAHDFLRIVYHRNLNGARKLHWLDKQWAKVSFAILCYASEL